MIEIVGECSICGIEMIDNEEAYALTAGTMRKDMEDFCLSDGTPWDVICVECMDEIDKAILGIQERQKALRERKPT